MKLFNKKIEIKTPQQRKDESIKMLKKNKIKVFEELPVIENYEEAKIRTKEEIVKRAVALCLVSNYASEIGRGAEVKKVQEFFSNIINQYNAATFFTNNENEFMNRKTTTQQEMINFSWRWECYNVLLWALGFFDDLGMPNKVCDVGKIANILVDNNTYEVFERNSKVREKEEILDEADLIYRYDWACVDARINGKKIDNLEPGVVLERHRALNWLINYMDQDWDNVTTDT